MLLVAHVNGDATLGQKINGSHKAHKQNVQKNTLQAITCTCSGGASASHGLGKLSHRKMSLSSHSDDILVKNWNRNCSSNSCHV